MEAAATRGLVQRGMAAAERAAHPPMLPAHCRLSPCMLLRKRFACRALGSTSLHVDWPCGVGLHRQAGFT